MELPRRDEADRYLPPGRYGELQSEIRRRVCRQNIPIMFIYAFDFRTRLGPFMFVDRKLIPGAPRAVAAALHAAGFTNLRVVMQPWNPKLRPSRSRFDGSPPEVLFVSAMQIHSAAAYRLILDAWQLGDDRPLILAGGPKAIFEPWDLFGLSPDGTQGADVVVTGEEFVTLELLDRIVRHKLPGESMRAAFERTRDEGLLEDVPGLVYRPNAAEGPPEYLVNTGVQRLLQNLDELPMPFDILGLFEPPHRNNTLSLRPLPLDQVNRHAKIMSVETTHGCKFHCPYCSIPAYNQFGFRYKSPDRLVDEISGIASRSGISAFFGTDDNIFNDRDTIEGVFTAMSHGTVDGQPFKKAITFATEATEFDVFQNQDLLPLARDAGLRSLWFGIEDLTGGLVKKGQSADKTKTVFKALLKLGIAPMPMMIHHDGQPLWSWKSLYGLLNQVKFLRRAGAISCQVTLLTPTPGSRSYADYFRDGLALCRVGGKPVEDYHYDGSHVVATEHDHPWQRQLNFLASYAAFYNPVNLMRALPKFDSLWKERLAIQVYGMWGTAKSTYQIRNWLRRLVTGQVERFSELPTPKFPMVSPESVDRALASWTENKGQPVLG